jgi:hypothetical protein
MGGRAEAEERNVLISKLFYAFPRGATKDRVSFYAERTASLALPDLTAAVALAEQRWEQQSVPPLAVLRRYAGEARAQRASAEHVEPGRARDVVLARLRERGQEHPTEEAIWREFVQFADFLGPYRGAADSTLLRGFAERWITEREREERRLYGAVTEDARLWGDELLLLVEDGPRPVERAGRMPVLPDAERLAVWDRAIEQAQAEGAPAHGKRLAFLLRARAALVARLRRRAEAKQAARGGPEPVLMGDVLGEAMP